MQQKNDHPEGCKCPMCSGGKCEACGGCACGSCHCFMHGGCRRRWLRWLIGIIVLAIVFCAGFKLGAMFSFWGGGYREMPVRYMMRGGGGSRYPVPMMYGWNGNYSGAQGSTTTGQ